MKRPAIHEKTQTPMVNTHPDVWEGVRALSALTAATDTAKPVTARARGEYEATE
jgi:hypothetical protein